MRGPWRERTLAAPTVVPTVVGVSLSRAFPALYAKNVCVGRLTYVPRPTTSRRHLQTNRVIDNHVATNAQGQNSTTVSLTVAIYLAPPFPRATSHGGLLLVVLSPKPLRGCELPNFGNRYLLVQ
jgi:hypothetical protein